MDFKKDDIIKIKSNHEWANCLAYISEVEKWGVVAFVPIPLKGNAYIRLSWDEFEKINN